MNINEWLNYPPKEEEIKIRDGAKYIPYDIIVDKLDQLSPHQWNTKNFQCNWRTVGKKIVVSGTVEVDVTYKIGTETYNRTLAGASTFVLNKQSNPHPDATSKSLAIMNAVKPLGKQFGKGLNDDIDNEKFDSGSILTDAVVDDTTKEFITIKEEISKVETKEQAMNIILDKYPSWKFNVELKEIINAIK
jgi:hypothetical protein